MIDLHSRRLSVAATSPNPDADLGWAAIKMAVAVRSGREQIEGVSFHSGRGSTYTAKGYTTLCVTKLGIRQSMDQVGPCFDNAAAESFSSTLEWDALPRSGFRKLDHTREISLDWCHNFYNTTRRHSSANMMSRINYENVGLGSEAAQGKPPRFRGNPTSFCARRLVANSAAWAAAEAMVQIGASVFSATIEQRPTWLCACTSVVSAQVAVVQHDVNCCFFR